jgi:23S rRNA (cytosine1962-C5)-methyltransferase
MSEIILKVDREKSILRHHPWIFSGAVHKVNGSPGLGETVDIVSFTGEFLARAAYNPNSNIIGRIWTWDINEQVDPDFLSNRLISAINARRIIKNLLLSDALRLVHAESDGLPGLILDQYREILVVQLLTAGMEYWKDVLINLIIKNTSLNVLFERSDLDVRELEGLPLWKGPLYGQLSDNNVLITENDLKFTVDVVNGHKTGYYLDQRENRLYARMLSKGLRVLDCFSYNGGFGINSLVGGAESVTLVDSSSTALEIARENIIQNNLNMGRVQFVEQDVFRYLRTLRDNGEFYDMVILDPPKFAPTAAHAERAARGYKDINLLALKLLRPGGYLMTFSCSGGINEELFQKIVFGAALDAGIDAVIIKRLHQAIDHPVALNFPEGAYLKGFVIQKRN